MQLKCFVRIILYAHISFTNHLLEAHFNLNKTNFRVLTCSWWQHYHALNRQVQVNRNIICFAGRSTMCSLELKYCVFKAQKLHVKLQCYSGSTWEHDCLCQTACQKMWRHFTQNHRFETRVYATRKTRASSSAHHYRTKFYCNPSSRCWDILVWIKVIWHCHL